MIKAPIIYSLSEYGVSISGFPSYKAPLKPQCNILGLRDLEGGGGLGFGVEGLGLRVWG